MVLAAVILGFAGRLRVYYKVPRWVMERTAAPTAADPPAAAAEQPR